MYITTIVSILFRSFTHIHQIHVEQLSAIIFIAHYNLMPESIMKMCQLNIKLGTLYLLPGAMLVSIFIKQLKTQN